VILDPRLDRNAPSSQMQFNSLRVCPCSAFSADGYQELEMVLVATEDQIFGERDA
jgi:hypothetical protein